MEYSKDQVKILKDFEKILNISLLHEAVIKENKECIEFLLKNDFDVNAFNQDGNTPLMLAVTKRNIKFCKVLIEGGADTNFKQRNGYSILINAISSYECKKSDYKGRKELCELLIDNGANMNESLVVPYFCPEKLREKTTYMTPLEYAIYHKDTEIIELLIKKGVKIDVNMLFRAIEANNKKLLLFLIENGADINAHVDIVGQTLLMWALENCDNEMCKLLIEKGADVNAKDDCERTSLIYVSIYGDNEMCKLLIEKGADVNAKDINGKTTLMWVSEIGDKEICRLLIEKGAEINAKNYDGKTALAFAASKRQNKEICELLITNGADVEVCKDKISEDKYEMIQTMKKEYDDLIKGRNVSRCHFIKEELMASVWNPERDFTKWALMDEFSEELKPIAGAGLY